MQKTLVKLDDSKWHFTSAAGTLCGISKGEGLGRIVDTRNVSTNETFPPATELCPKCFPPR